MIARRSVCCVLMFLVFYAPAAMPARHDVRLSLRTLLDSKTSVVNELRTMDHTLARLERERLARVRKQKLVQKALQKAQIEIQDLEQSLQLMKKRLRRRLLAYKQLSPLVRVKIILGAPNLADSIRRARLIRLLNRHDKKLLKHMQQMKHRHTILQDNYVIQHFQLEQMQQQIAKQQSDIAKVRSEKLALLAIIEESQKLQAKIGKEYVRSSQRLQKIIIKQAAKKIQQQDPFVAKERSLLSPVKGRLVSGFGAKRETEFNTYTVNNGLYFSCASGSVVQSVSHGKVIYSDVLPAYGKVVIVDHENQYHSIYANLASLAKKRTERVEQGDVLGYVSSPDHGNEANLYFEIRYEGKPVDPLPLLRQ